VAFKDEYASMELKNYLLSIAVDFRSLLLQIFIFAT